MMAGKNMSGKYGCVRGTNYGSSAPKASGCLSLLFVSCIFSTLLVTLAARALGAA